MWCIFAIPGRYGSVRQGGGSPPWTPSPPPPSTQATPRPPPASSRIGLCTPPLLSRADVAKTIGAEALRCRCIGPQCQGSAFLPPASAPLLHVPPLPSPPPSVPPPPPEGPQPSPAPHLHPNRPTPSPLRPHFPEFVARPPFSSRFRQQLPAGPHQCEESLEATPVPAEIVRAVPAQEALPLPGICTGGVRGLNGRRARGPVRRGRLPCCAPRLVSSATVAAATDAGEADQLTFLDPAAA